MPRSYDRLMTPRAGFRPLRGEARARMRSAKRPVMGPRGFFAMPVAAAPRPDPVVSTEKAAAVLAVPAFLAAPAFLAESRPHPRLRVLTFMNSFAPGGVERVAARLHAAWRAGGMDSRLVLADGRIAAPLAVDAVSQVAGRPHASTVARFVALLRGLPATIAAERPDVLFCAGNTYAGLAVALRLVLGGSCPPIVAKISNDLVRGDMPAPMRALYRLWLRVQGRYIDHFIAIAPAMRDEIARLVGVAPERISVIADPALAEDDLVRLAGARDAAVRTRPGRHYLAVGRLARQKNFGLLLEAFARIATPADTLTILGDGIERAMLEERVRTLGLEHAVRLPGHVDPLDAWLAQADALVLSSDYEGMPAVLIEGLAAGLPIVATDCCVSMRDLLDHGALGAVVPRGDAAALGAAMAAVPRARDPAIVAARRAAAAAFTIEQAGDAYLAVMRTLVRARAVA